MTNLVPSIPITLDKPRLLRFDAAALITFQQTSGRSFFDVLKALLEIQGSIASAVQVDTDTDTVTAPDTAVMFDLLAKLPLADICTLVWAGLRHEDASLKPEDIQSMIWFGNLPAVVTTLAQALAVQGPEPDKEAPPTPQNPSPAV